MKKTLIALAVAGVVTAPAAMAEVTISGGLQAEVRNVGGDGVTTKKGLYLTDGGEAGDTEAGSYGFLKFAATEDLGDGFKGIAVYNMNVKVDEGIGTREAFVGLSGGFGTLVGGRAPSPYKSSTVSWDPFLATSLQARGNGGMSDANNGYVNNAIAYALPQDMLGGVKVVLAIAVDEGDEVPASDKTNGEHAKAISVNAPVGPVEVALAYEDASKFSDITQLGLSHTAQALGNGTTPGTPGSVVATLNTLTAAKAGVKFSADALTIAAQYEQLELKTTSGASAIKPTVAYATASYAMGNNTLSLGYGVHTWDISGIDDTTYMAVGVNHAFSKTMSSFVGFRSTDAGNRPVNLTAATPVESKKEDTLSLGLRVNF